MGEILHMFIPLSHLLITHPIVLFHVENILDIIKNLLHNSIFAQLGGKM